MASRTVPGKTGTTHMFENLEDRQLFAGNPLALGLNANNVTTANYPAIVAAAREAGSTSMRLWYSIESYRTRETRNVLNFLERFKNDGFDITLSVVPEQGLHGTAAETRGFFRWLVSVPGLIDNVDRWEVGNEPDSQYYWKGTLQEYVSDLLAPAARVLHEVGEKVVSAGVAWNPADIKTLVQAGMLQHVDYVGYHPYRYTLANLRDSIAQVKAFVDNKPLVATEWNIRGYESNPNRKLWATAIAEAWPIIRDNFYAAYYYAAMASGTRAGASGMLVQGTLAKNEPFYTTIVSLQKTLGGGNAVIPNFPDTTTGGGTGSGSGSGTGTGTNSGTGTGTGTGAGTGNGNTGSGTTNNNTGGVGSKPGTGWTPGGNGTPNGSGSGSSGSGSSGSGSGTGTGSTGGNGGTTTTPTPRPPRVGSVYLMPVGAGSVDGSIGGVALQAGSNTIDLASLRSRSVTFAVNTAGTVGSVQIVFGKTKALDSTRAFSLYGELNGVLRTQAIVPGVYTLRVRAYAGTQATGAASRYSTFTVNIIDSATTRPPFTTGAVYAQQIAQRYLSSVVG